MFLRYRFLQFLSKKPSFFSSFSLLFLINSVAYANFDTFKADLLLAGGGLRTCSSMATQNCTKNNFSEQAFQSHLYLASTENIQKWKNTQPYAQLNEKDKENIDSVLVNLNSKDMEEISRSQLRNSFQTAGHLQLYRNLSDAAYYALLDSLEVRQVDTNGHRKREQTLLSSNKNEHSIKIYRSFVQQAALRVAQNETKPRIAVLTASSRDPFESADFYLSVFQEAGADVIWLPLDKSYQQAKDLEKRGLNGCQSLASIRAENHQFYRQHIYPTRADKQFAFCMSPQKMLDAIESAQGIFFNGGDQSLTLAALQKPNGEDSAELRLIKHKNMLGELIVGGTSAGTAVQAGGAFANKPVPMLTNGHSELAMQRGAFATPPPSQRCSNADCGQGLLADDLTYKADGGTGLFPYGLLDTHFSERDRETRLAVFLATTGQRFAFGVDEATAFLVKHRQGQQAFDFKVVGQGGVYALDNQFGQYFVTYKPAGNQSRVQEKALGQSSHYLVTGMTGSFNFGKANGLTLTSKYRDKIKTFKPIKLGTWRDNIRSRCGKTNKHNWQDFDNQYSIQPSAETLFALSEDSVHCGYINLPFSITSRQLLN